MNEALFILGYHAAQHPAKVSARLERAAIVARQVLYEGGAFNPLNVWDMQNLTVELGYRAPVVKS